MLRNKYKVIKTEVTRKQKKNEDHETDFKNKKKEQMRQKSSNTKFYVSFDICTYGAVILRRGNTSFLNCHLTLFLKETCFIAQKMHFHTY